MSYEKFQALIEHRNPVFVCKPAGRSRDSERFTARISHVVRPPGTLLDLAHLQRIIPIGSERLLDFYRIHDGCMLYADTLSDAAGISLFKIRDMRQQTRSFREWRDRLADEGDENHLGTAIAVGECPHSGNYFAMPVEGPQAGKVFFVDHDDFHEGPFAVSFDDFLAQISTDPAHLLSVQLGCTTRYSDGETDTQWIPIEYRAGI
jgi:hypothetical protein